MIFFLKTHLIFLFVLLNPFLNLRAVTIYGEDGRKDLYEISSNTLREIALSTAVQVDNKLILDKGQFVKFNSVPLERVKYLNPPVAQCKGQKFGHQLKLGRCSGFLVNPDTLITAGHCITNDSDCSNFSWIFNYNLDHETDIKAVVHEKHDIYRCKSIIKKLNVTGPELNIDYAIIKLDRPNYLAKPGKISSVPVKLNENLIMMGYPLGLPLKVIDGGRVTQITSNGFKSNLDGFHGSSGSLVLNAKTEQIVGIFSRGNPDFILDEKNNCAKPYVSNSFQPIEYSTSIKFLKDKI